MQTKVSMQVGWSGTFLFWLQETKVDKEVSPHAYGGYDAPFTSDPLRHIRNM